MTWAYRLFLDREPENEAAVVSRAARWSGTHALRTEFLGSDEYRQRNRPAPFPVLLGDEPAIEVETDLSEADCRRLFEHVQETWRRLGEVDPHWSVLTAESYRVDRFAEHASRFYDSGRADVARLVRTLHRNGIDPRRLRACLEFGCGVGRLTRWLAAEFEHVHGIDISPPHLRLAESYLNDEGIGNATLGHLASLNDLETLPRSDLVYSVIVLQHNPPPVIRYVLHHLLRALKPGGVAYVQVPTYRPGYRFRLDEYLQGPARHEMEMHILPQQVVFEVIREEDCAPLEVLEDTWTGPPFNSNTFLVRKL